MRTCVISCPLDTYSGYGKRALDLVKCIVDLHPDWDIRILSQRWGSCAQGYLRDHEEWDLIGKLVYTIAQKPDIWIQVTVPNEFQPLGMFNVGVTAAMETTLSDISWVEGCNRMDLVLCSSEHSKRSLQASKYLNKTTGQAIEVTAPLEVLFEGVDLDKYYRVPKASSFRSPILGNALETSNNFLLFGHWLPGNFGQDRKNIGYTIRMFLEAFKDRDDAPGLVVNTQVGGSSSIPGKYEILRRIEEIKKSVFYKKSLPKVYLLYGKFTDKEINEIYNDGRIKTMVSFTKGEGFGRPLLEFASIGKPIICSGWSGPLDFLKKENTLLIGGRLTKVDPSAQVKNMILPEAWRFTPDDKQVIRGLQEIASPQHHAEWQKKAREQEECIRKDFSLEAMNKKFEEIMSRYMPQDFPEYRYLEHKAI